MVVGGESETAAMEKKGDIATGLTSEARRLLVLLENTKGLLLVGCRRCRQC